MVGPKIGTGRFTKNNPEIFFEFFGDIKQSIIENQNNQGLLQINY